MIALRSKLLRHGADAHLAVFVQRLFPGHGPLQRQARGLPHAHGDGVAAYLVFGHFVQQLVRVLQHAGERCADVDKLDGTGERGLHVVPLVDAVILESGQVVFL